MRNDGTHAANVPVTLHFPSPDKQPETRRPRIAPGQTGTATFTWRTGRYHYGEHTFRVEVPTANPHTFTATLLPPTVDFAVAEIYPPSASYPIVKGDWVEVAAFVRNFGPYTGRAQVVLRDLTERRAMYSQNITLPPGGARVVEFTWKTLRYDAGEHRLQVSVAASHDINPDNDYSEIASVDILPNRDIIVGFGNGNGDSNSSDGDNDNDAPAVIAAAMAAPNIRVPAQYPPDIIAFNTGGTATASMTAPSAAAGFGAPSRQSRPSPEATATDPAIIASLTESAFQCVQLQRRMGHILPRSLLCPNAPPLIR